VAKVREIPFSGKSQSGTVDGDVDVLGETVDESKDLGE